MHIASDESRSNCPTWAIRPTTINLNKECRYKAEQFLFGTLNIWPFFWQSPPVMGLTNGSLGDHSKELADMLVEISLVGNDVSRENVLKCRSVYTRPRCCQM